MKRKSSVLFILLAAVLIIGFTMFGCTSGTTGEEPVELRISLWSSEVHHNYTHVWKPWADEIEEATNGMVTATIYAGGALGTATEQYDLLVGGGADIAGWNPGFTPGVFPLMGVAELPFFSPTQEIGTEVLQRLAAKYPEFQGEADPVHLMYIGNNVPIVLNTVSKPVRTMEDMQGLQIRVNSPGGGEIITALGGTPVFMGMMDLYTALERGTIDGAIYTLEAVQSFGLGPVTNYTVDLPITTVQTCNGIGDPAYQSLPSDVQELITTGALGQEWITEHNQEGMALGLQQGLDILAARGDAWELITLTPEEEARWRDTLAPLADEWAAARDAEGSPGSEIVADARQWLEELS